MELDRCFRGKVDASKAN